MENDYLRSQLGGTPGGMPLPMPWALTQGRGSAGGMDVSSRSMMSQHGAYMQHPKSAPTSNQTLPPLPASAGGTPTAGGAGNGASPRAGKGGSYAARSPTARRVTMPTGSSSSASGGGSGSGVDSPTPPASKAGSRPRRPRVHSAGTGKAASAAGASDAVVAGSGSSTLDKMSTKARAKLAKNSVTHQWPLLGWLLMVARARLLTTVWVCMCRPLTRF